MTIVVYEIKLNLNLNFGIHDVEGLKLLTQLNSVIEENKHLLLHCQRYGLLGGLSLTASLAPLTLTLNLFVPVTGVICYCMVTLDSTWLDFINQTKRFKKQVDKDSI